MTRVSPHTSDNIIHLPSTRERAKEKQWEADRRELEQKLEGALERISQLVEAKPPGRGLMVELSLDGLGLTAQLPSGRTVDIPENMAGLCALRDLAKRAAATAAAARDPDFGHRQGVTPQQLQGLVDSVYSPSDYSRVCHCGMLVTQFMARCDGCPGHSGAGKIRTAGPGAPQITKVPSSDRRSTTKSAEELGL